MSELFAVISGVISGGCLFIIAVRSGMPLFGSIISQEAKQNLEPLDKFLAIVALIFFVICMMLLLTTY